MTFDLHIAHSPFQLHVHVLDKIHTTHVQNKDELYILRYASSIYTIMRPAYVL